jgi:hypothetical protein
MARLYAATGESVAVVENGRMILTLEERGARCLVIDPKDSNTLYVGTSNESLFKSSDGGRSWERLSGVAYTRITALAISPVDGALYAGTEPSSLFASRDGGGSWRELEGLKNLPSASTWSFPPRPWTSHVRSIALSYEDPNLVVAGIELGGVVRSEDGGESWQDQRPGAYADCHLLTAHAATPNTLYEAAGGGYAESEDFGESWVAADEGLKHHYVWGLAVDRDDPTLLYVSAAFGPGRAHGGGFSDAAIYRRRTKGRWEPVVEHLSEFPYTLVGDPEKPGALYAGFGNGRIVYSHNAGENWDDISYVPGVDALAVVAT